MSTCVPVDRRLNGLFFLLGLTVLIFILKTPGGRKRFSPSGVFFKNKEVKHTKLTVRVAIYGNTRSAFYESEEPGVTT